VRDPEKLAKRAEMERRECKFCLYYDPASRDCSVGMKNCVLDEAPDSVLETGPPDKPSYPCRSCSYGKGERPCVSFCMKKVMEEWRMERQAAGKEGADNA